ncbi:MAG: cohesin domain-containing protein, partial [Terracidiphilus sp.]
VPGQTAQAAGPGALAQLRSSAVGNAPPTAANGGVPPVAPAPGGVRLALVPSTGSSAAVGSTIQVPVVITGAHDIASVPLEVKYDPSKLSLVNVGDGDFLNRDGQTVTLIHSDDATAGEVKINTTRPPGAAGISGAGVVCVLSFQAKAAGQTTIGIERTGATTSAQQLVQADLGQTTIVVK